MTTKNYPGDKISPFPIDSDQHVADALYISVGFGQNQPPTTKGPTGDWMVANVLSPNSGQQAGDIKNCASQNATAQSWGGFSYSAADHPPSADVRTKVDAAYSWFMANQGQHHGDNPQPSGSGKQKHHP